ncbi:MAG: D-amino-acid transaminase [Proteobacteria bacterium]|nr:D-amino-acid transaminase [Pseudomonadota bacterium]
MARISYVNGKYVHHAQAMVHVEDRGYQFADGVYEYIAFYNRTPLDGGPHLQRLERSAGELGIAMPMGLRPMALVVQELIARNGREDGGIYIQVTRGVARRDHVFPARVKPALVMTLCAAKLPKPQDVKNGVRAITHPDIRWVRRDIKSVSLLANVVARQKAAEVQAREAWLIDGGVVTEGAVSNAYIVNKAGEVVTHPADTHILNGITRSVVLRLAREGGIAVREEPFSMADIGSAAEAFITSTSAGVLPVTRVDDMMIGGGKPGPITQKLQALYAAHIYQQTGKQF